MLVLSAQTLHVGSCASYSFICSIYQCIKTQSGLKAPCCCAYNVGSSSTPPGHRCPVRDDGLATLAAPVQAILVMTDPRDWYRDMQLIIDTVTGHGVPTRPAEECTGNERHGAKHSWVGGHHGEVPVMQMSPEGCMLRIAAIQQAPGHAIAAMKLSVCLCSVLLERFSGTNASGCLMLVRHRTLSKCT